MLLNTPEKHWIRDTKQIEGAMNILGGRKIMPRIDFYQEFSCPWSNSSPLVLKYININYISVSHDCSIVYVYSNEVVSLQTTNGFAVQSIIDQ